MEGAMRSAKRHIRPIDMEIIYRAYRSVWTVLNDGKLVTNSDEARELGDKVTRKLVEVAREGVIDLDTLRERALAEIMRP
jgi:hypothetical protein